MARSDDDSAEKAPLLGDKRGSGEDDKLRSGFSISHSPLSSRSYRQSIEISTGSIHLKKNITLIHAVGILVGTMIGSGIFVSPQGIVARTGSIGATLLVWGSLGLYTLLLGMCYAELGCILPLAGGDYVYVGAILGPLPGFVCGWVQVLVSSPSSGATIAQTAGLYLARSMGLDCRRDLVTLIAVLILIVLAAVNSLSVRVGSRVATGLAFSKVASLAVIIVLGIVYLPQGNGSEFQQPFANTSSNAGSIALAFLDGIFAYKGWEMIATLPEEMPNVKRDLPLSMVIGVLVVTSIYVLTNVAYFAVLTLDEITSSLAVALTFADYTMGSVAWLVAIFVALSCMGTIASAYITDTRYTFAAGRQGQAPVLMSLLHRDFLTPIPAIVLMCILCMIYVAIPGIEQLTQIASLSSILKNLMCLVALLHHRRRYPDADRPLKVPLVVIVCAMVMLLALLGLALYGDPLFMGVTVVLCATGVPAYGLNKWLNRSPRVTKFMTSLTKGAQKILLVTPESKKAR